MESTDNPIFDQTITAPENEEVVEKKHKIDPKKLIVYSEIMKPKFDE